MDSEAQSAKFCPACRSKMAQHAWKCPTCQYTRGWKGSVSTWIPVLSLLVALFATAPIIKDAVDPPRGAFHFLFKTTSSERLKLVVSNLGSENIVVSPEIDCDNSENRTSNEPQILLSLSAEKPETIRVSESEIIEFEFFQLLEFGTGYEEEAGGQIDIANVIRGNSEPFPALTCLFDVRDKHGKLDKKQNGIIRIDKINGNLRISFDESQTD